MARTEYFSTVAPIIQVPEMTGKVLGLPSISTQASLLAGACARQKGKAD
jgi:hypothetical protein